MKTSIYKVAMYEIISLIKKDCPVYDFADIPEEELYSSSFSQNDSTVDAIFQYTDKLKEYFPRIDANTYCMIVCGAIMQTFVSNLAYFSDFDEGYFEKLQSPFADEKTKAYFSAIFQAIDSMREFYYFDEYKEIIEWPDEFGFTLLNSKAAKEEYHNYLLEAIALCPEYSYAYCLLDVPHFNTLEGVHFQFAEEEEELKKAFVKSHRYLGNELFQYLFSGYFQLSSLTYEIYGEDEELCADDIIDYVSLKEYSVKDVEKMDIQKGYFCIDDQLYPCGIPFFTRFEPEEYYQLMNRAFSYVETQRDNNIAQRRCLRSTYHTRIEFKEQAIYGGLLHLMPLYDCYADMTKQTAEFLHQQTMNRLVYKLLGSNAEEMDRLEAANQTLEKLNAELKSANESLKRHIELNQELVRNLSHSSANYLNSEKLARTGIELHKAEKDNPTVDELHLEGLSLLLQSEQEMFLSRQLNSLVWRCSANTDSLTRHIREGLSESEGCSILAPIEFAMKTVMARVLFRDEDRRGQFIQFKMEKTDEEIIKMKSAFMLDVLAADSQKEGVVVEWWNTYVGPLSIQKSAVWEPLKIVKDKAFYDLITEILTEQILNALSHGDLQNEIVIELGQAEEFAGYPSWTYVACSNHCGIRYSGGRNVGISTLNETISLLNSNKRGIETKETDGLFESKVWLLSNFLRTL